MLTGESHVFRLGPNSVAKCPKQLGNLAHAFLFAHWGYVILIFIRSNDEGRLRLAQLVSMVSLQRVEPPVFLYYL